MIELYINDRLCDLTEDVDISFTYTNVDTETPTAEKNSFSKSVELKGTQNNNAIFGDAWDLSRNILEGEGTGVYFDPRKRVDFKLVDNGDVVETGYIQLDEITIEDGEITYSITLYGGIGDFFYSLMYDEEGNERDLSSIKYGFDTLNEDKTLCYWTKDFIKESWEKLLNSSMYGRDSSDMTVSNCITAVPTYSGMYDDFDNDKVLVNYNSMPEAVKDLLPDYSGKKSGPYKDWILATLPRDVDEWEVEDLRSQHQRPAIKTSVLLDAVSNPENNGGYEVVWDNEITDSAYYKDSWIMFDRIDFENDETANKVNSLLCATNQIDASDIATRKLNISMIDTLGTTTFELSDIQNPVVDIDLNTSITLSEIGKCKTYQRAYVSGYVDGTYHPTTTIMGGWHIRLDCYVGGVLHSSTPDYIVWTLKKTPSETSKLFAKFKEKLGLHSEPVCVYDEIIPQEGTKDSKYHKWKDNLNLHLELPSESNVQLKLVYEYESVNSLNDIEGKSNNDYYVLRDRSFYHQINYYSDFKCSVQVVDSSDLTVNGIYNGIINPNVQLTNVTKKLLFGDSDTPFAYLVGFTKALGARFRKDNVLKKVYIELRKNYYKDTVVDINELIDRSKTVTITPTLTENKWYIYGFNTPESYAQKLYSQKNKVDYGKYKLDTGYYFNNEEKDLFDENIYTSAIPYKLTSIFFNYVEDMPNAFLSPTLEITTFDSGLTESTTTIYGYSKYNSLNRIKDKVDKLCCFDDSNGNVSDIKNCLVFFNGTYADNSIVLTDNLPIMSSLNENPCHILSWSERGYADVDASATTEVVHFVGEIPRFSKYLTDENGAYTDSLDYKKPNMTFIGNSSAYGEGITLFDRYWDSYITDLYDKNARAVELYVFLKDNPQEAMRKGYYFDNSVWVISEITDYNRDNDGPTKVKFVKCYDYENAYLK